MPVDSNAVAKTPTWFRAAETAYTLKRIEHNDSYLLVSLPGIGKTFFLRLLQHRLTKQKNIVPILVDLNSIREVTTESVYQCMLDGVNETFSNIAYTNFEEFSKASKNKRKQYVFLIDRFEKAVTTLPATFFDSLRAFIVDSDRHITFITSLSQELPVLRHHHDIDQFYTMVSPFTEYLRPFTSEESSYYITQKTEERNMRLTPDQITTLYKITGGHNRLIDAYIYYLTSVESKTFEKSLENAAHNESVLFQCQRILNILTDHQRQALSRLVVKLKLSERDNVYLEQLKRFGVLNDHNEVFSLRLRDYILEQHADLFLDEVTGEVYKKGQRIDDYFTPNEYKFFRHMYEHQGRVIEREEIAEAVWGVKQKQGVSDEAIDQLVSRLREKIELDKNNPKHLNTIRGRGFQLKIE